MNAVPCHLCQMTNTELQMYWIRPGNRRWQVLVIAMITAQWVATHVYVNMLVACQICHLLNCRYAELCSEMTNVSDIQVLDLGFLLEVFLKNMLCNTFGGRGMAIKANFICSPHLTKFAGPMHFSTRTSVQQLVFKYTFCFLSYL